MVTQKASIMALMRILFGSGARIAGHINFDQALNDQALERSTNFDLQID